MRVKEPIQRKKAGVGTKKSKPIETVMSCVIQLGPYNNNNVVKV